MLSKLSEVGVALLNSILGPQVGVILIEWLHVFLEQCILLSRRASLELLDVIHVRPAEDEEATEESNEPSLSLIIEAIRLVPVGELSNVLVRVLSLVSWLQALARKLRVHILLWKIGKSTVGTLVRVRILKSIHPT